MLTNVERYTPVEWQVLQRVEEALERFKVDGEAAV